MIYRTLEFIEPEQMEDVLAGTFLYTQEDGQQVEAKFYVRCSILDPTDRDSKSRRQNAVNEQLEEQWERLMAEENKNIVYKEIDPNPFF